MARFRRKFKKMFRKGNKFRYKRFKKAVRKIAKLVGEIKYQD